MALVHSGEHTLRGVVRDWDEATLLVGIEGRFVSLECVLLVHGARSLIHGHVEAPAHEVDGASRERLVEGLRQAARPCNRLLGDDVGEMDADDAD